MMRRIALLTVLILFTLLAVGMLWQLRSVVVVFFLALAIAAVLDRPLNGLIARGWRTGPAILVVYGGCFGGLFLLAAILSAPLVKELDPLVQDLLLEYDGMQTRLRALSGIRLQFVARLPTTDQVAMWLSGGQVTVIINEFVGLTQNLGNLLGQGFLALVLAIYWAADQARFERLWLSLLAPESRSRARAFWRRLQADLGAYIRSEVIQSLLAGGLLTFGYWLLGVKYPFTLAFLASLAWLVPVFGAMIALIAAFIVGALSSPMLGIGVVLFTAAILAVMEFWVERLFFRSDRYWGVLVLLVMLALGDGLGLFGLLLAPPVAVALQIALNQFLQPPPIAESTPSAADLEHLRDRLGALRSRLASVEEEASPRVLSLTQKLADLLTEAEQAGRPDK